MSHCNPASTVSINLSNVAGAPFSPNGMILILKAKKCHLFCKKVVYLGHVISEAGIATDPEKKKIVEFVKVRLANAMGLSFPSTS
jgi:hypothetical protein